MKKQKWREKLNFYFYRQRLYAPIIPHILKLGVKAGSMSFFTAANPGFRNGGFVNTSKYDILTQINKQYLPNTILVKPNEPVEAVLETLYSFRNNPYPLIIKPNIGERGMGVRKLMNEQELLTHLAQLKTDHVIQEFVAAPIEVCILYYRLPGADRGEISSIGLKDFMEVVGDGSSTVLDLIRQNKYIQDNMDIEAYIRKHPQYIHYVPEMGQSFRITDVASRGTGVVFKNINHIYSAQLVDTFDKISSTVDGFFYGRFDVKINSYEELARGENIMILELNGVNAQPIHSYDPNFSRKEFITEIKRHWDIIYKISIHNMKAYGLRPNIFLLIREILRHTKNYQ